MKVDMEIDYIAALVSVTTVNSVYHVQTQNNNAAEKDTNIYNYHVNLLKSLTVFSESLLKLRSIHRENSDLFLPEEYSALIVGYFKLLEDVFLLLSASHHGVSLNLVIEILSHIDSVTRVADEILKKRFLSVDIEKTIFPNVLKSRIRLEDEKNIKIIGTIQVEVNKKVENEVDYIRKDIKNKVKDVDIKYSEGRNEIINSFKEYENEVAILLNKASDTFEKHKIDGDEIISDIKNKKSSIDSLMTSIEAQLKLTEGILKDTSQLGMARAFKERHSALKIPMWFWIISFFSCLGLLTNVSVMFVDFVFLSKSEIKSTAEVISRLAITLPFIWGAWFSAKQYNHVNQLREDYAYKVAVAMTYHGYKDEAQQTNSQMNEKLLESIVAQFSENPVRLYRNDNSASLFEAVIKNNKLSEVISSIKGGK
ncbi:hypothetical protein AOX56_13795 [Aeromonas sobria]|uniref:Uncharacterized protein n=1 Tax=Aeromonas sobria TaxID=646 RepID=A0A2N3J1W9_AERSO|nr:hypothetical protein [Aeromonas sobria]PKQ79647.1 hypothetical protein AOX56_13795 [Aeromonas sobria]